MSRQIAEADQLRAELNRLSDELEQARVALEDREAEIGALAG